jgi:subtilisin family serine protease
VDCAGVTNWWFVITGIDWVILNRIRPAVAEISYAGWLSSTLNLAIQRLVAANVEVAVAAGNGGGDACLMSPSSAPDAETVAATTSNDDRVASSNIGRCLDFFAPSEGVTSAWYTGDQDTKVFSGTSMATAHVAGAMALVRQAYPFIPAPSAGLILRNNATYGVVKNPGLNSPNYLLYTKWIPYPPPPPR